MYTLTGFIVGLVYGWFIGAIIVFHRISEGLKPTPWEIANKFDSILQNFGAFIALISPDSFLAGIIGSFAGLIIGITIDSRLKGTP